MATGSVTCEIAVCLSPALTNLVAAHVKIGAQLLEEYYSYHTAVTVITRDLSINNLEILCCPGWREDDFFMIMSQERWQESGWREGLAGAHLELIDDRTKVNVEMFASSVWFTIMCRLTPEWNRIGHLFIQGCDFLMNANCRKHRAIELKVAYLPPGRLQLILTPYTVTFDQLTLKDFGGSVAASNVFQNKKNNATFAFGEQSCYVLPRLTKGSIISLSKSLPPRSIFENYNELQNYWKGMYGYCLPRENPEFYCEVSFLGPSKNIFTYPNFCLLSKPLQTFETTEREWSQCIKAFTTDLYVKMVTICDVPLKMIMKTQSISSTFKG